MILRGLNQLTDHSHYIATVTIYITDRVFEAVRLYRVQVQTEYADLNSIESFVYMIQRTIKQKPKIVNLTRI